jgi:Domain of unknown function (DUF4232)
VTSVPRTVGRWPTWRRALAAHIARARRRFHTKESTDDPTLPEDRMRDLPQRLTPESPGMFTVEQVKAAAGRDSGIHLLASANAEPGGRSHLTHWAPMPAATVAAAIAVAVTGLAACSYHGQGPAAPGSSASLSNPPVAAASSAPTGVAACLASQLTASIARRGSTASAPFLIMALCNTATGPCALSGYPGIAVYAAASTAPVPIAIQHGTYEQADPGPRTVRLPAGGQASFALGSNSWDRGVSRMFASSG